MALFSSAVLAMLLAQSKPVPSDVSEFREQLVLLTDEKGHYLAFDGARPFGNHLFYSSDGKTFSRVRHESGGKNGDESWNNSFWDPRVTTRSGSPGFVTMRESGAVYEVWCAKKSTRLKALSAEEGKKLLGAATFIEPLWTREPEKLLRDDTGVYYLVDRFRSFEDFDRRDFRVFSGMKGAMKQLPLKNIVDDQQGLILATKDGNLRLVTGLEGKFEGKWVQGSKVTPLVEVDLARFETGQLIYLDLGPYSGQRLGTPCDDFM
jgi:hypothetical protein